MSTTSRPESKASSPPSLSLRIARMAAVVQETILRNRWIPEAVRNRLTAKQAQFLAHEGREAMFGGAAGGGKSFSLLMAALQYVDVPGYHALILRRTFKQLDKPDSIMSTAREWLSGTAAKWNEQKHQWTFPSGATLTFGHMEHERSIYDYQGSAYAYVGYDELTQFTEGQYTYLFSRQRRRAGVTIPMRMRSASNPGGIGHEWVYKRFVNPKTSRPGALFVPAKLEDNPNLDAEDYRQAMANLDPVTRAQLLAGDWTARKGGRFRAEWFKRRYRIVNREFGQGGEFDLDGRRLPVSHCWRFQTVDPAASSLETAKSADPDYTVISTWAVTPDYELIFLDCERFRLEIPDIVPQIQQAYSLHGPQYVCIEAVAANRAVYQLARRTPMIVQEVSPLGQDKLVRATSAIAMAKDGRIWLPQWAPWLDDVETELFLFTGDDKQDAHGDVIDTISYAAKALEEFGPGNDGLPMSLGQRYQ